MSDLFDNSLPSPDEERKADQGSLQNLIATKYFGYASFADASLSERSSIRIWMNNFFVVVGNIPLIIEQIESGDFVLDSSQGRVLLDLYKNRAILDEFIKSYVAVVDYDLAGYADGDNTTSETAGYQLGYLIDKIFAPFADQQRILEEAVDPFNYIDEQIKLMSMGDAQFTPYFEHLDAYKRVREMYLGDGTRPGKFRDDQPPAQIAPYQCRIGASTFFVPPTSISVHQAFTSGSLTNGVLRAPNSPKMNLGHSQTEITMTLYFPNHETIWGFAGEKADFDIFNWDPQPIIREDRKQVSGQQQVISNPVSDAVIDRYLSSLRGLVTQFKYAPFLPIVNQYLNRSYGITAVCMQSMTVNTVPDFPFVLAVNLNLTKFNYKPFLPMITNFDQAIHWGKYRQYMGKAAARLDSKVNQGFLVEKETTPTNGNLSTRENVVTVFEGDLLPSFDKVKDITSGAFFDFYYPITTPSRIFAPDTTDFRQPGEDQVITSDIWDGILSSLGLDVVEPPQFDFFEFDRAFRGSKFRNERRVLHNWLQLNNLAWQEMSPAKMNIFIEEAITNGKREGVINTDNEATYRAQLKSEWFYLVFEKVMDDDKGFQDLIRSRDFQNSNYTIKEWTVPMEKLYIDWTSCIVNNVAVSLSNNFAQLQVQLQDEPTYQHIGGGDSRVEVSMTILGEENLIRYRRLFEHIHGLARIEKVHGVMGFLGIKNVITSLCGIKYVLPLDFEINTVPGYPHVYNVNMSFIDFDIMQQEREKLSTAQQKSFIDQFGKRNPFLRLKQSWGAFNAYPDMPLDVRDQNGEIIGHLDADWYFRSFTTSESDESIFSWGFDETVSTLVNTIARLNMRLLEDGGSIDLDIRKEYLKQISEAEQELRTLVGDGSALPGGWKIVDGKVIVATDSDGNDMPEPEMIIRLGLYDKNQSKSSFVGFFPGGYMALGYEDVKSGKRFYQMGMSYFDEDLASKNLKNVPPIPGTVGLSDYQTELVGGGTDANKHYEAMMKDYNYRNMKGRMLKAFPTYMLWLIDEGGKFAGIKLFDNFYGLNSVIDFSVLSSQNAIDDTLVLRLSNIYQKLTTPYKDQLITEDDPLFNTAAGQWIFTTLNRARNLESGMTDSIIELNNIRLKPGVRIHLRGGYGSNPNNLQTLFNGVIAEVQPGDIMTVVAQSDAVEFTGYVNTINTKGSSGKLDGGLSSFWLSEPRDLMVRLLSMGSSNFKEWLAWGSKGVFYSDSRFGIRHFGNILYEPMIDTEITASRNTQRAAVEAMHAPKEGSAATFQGVLGDYAEDLVGITSITGLSSAFNGNLIKIGKMLWLNQFAKRDYEIFKRNIYPGNGSGIAQFMGGDMIDAGIVISTATTFVDKSSNSSSPRDGYGASQHPLPNNSNAEEDAVAESTREANEKDVKDLWSQYENNVGVTDDELDDMFTMSNNTSTDLTIKERKSEGLLESIFSTVEDIATVPFDILDGVHDIISENVPGGGFTATVLELFVGAAGGPLGLALAGNTLLKGTGRLVMGALNGGSGLAHILGLTSGIADDDISGFDEVSFRAQTYMKTVWDLFNVCAALLPNYIVAVRPFEDRSTVFYGKPHWLYTSGIIPITTGIPKDKSALPRLEGADNFLTDALNKAKQFSDNGIERMMGVIDESNSLKDIMSFGVGKDIDPYLAGGDPRVTALSTSEDLKLHIELLKSNPDRFENLDLVLQAIDGLDFSILSPEEISEALAGVLVMESFESGSVPFFPQLGDDREKFVLQVRTFYQEYLEKKRIALQNKIDNPEVARSKLLDQLYGKDKNGIINEALTTVTDGTMGDTFYLHIEEQINQLAKTDEEKAKLNEFYLRDPITFAFQFGWKINSIPVWYDPTSGFGIDKTGALARALYDESSSSTTDAVNDERSLAEANDIWGDFRNEFRYLTRVKDIYIRFFPMPDQEARFDEVVDLFQRYLWQDPYNRAWVINVVDKTGDGFWDTVSKAVPGNDNSNHWNWNPIVDAWREFLQDNNLEIDDETGEIHSAITRKFIQSNQKAGKDSHNFFSGVVEDISTWIDENVGQLIGLISDTITGFIASIRMSLMQMGNAVSQAGDMQRQANILNASLNNSIYYQWGAPDSIQRLVDNPFTREYGEPVIEVREPFQRIHFISSFDTILDNKIMENLNGVATVVTAVSDGKYPVTVHFDKAISPERQVEKVVETGLLWDNAVGSGLFGFLQPILHPLETLRAYSKTATGSSDQLSARRVALWHLKQSLQNIYTGEIVIIGDSDIRPYDLLYIADVYERMYGMVEVQQVTHHFTPETGFITSIVPNAIVTINDPVRWTFLSYMWNKMTNYNLRDDVRAMMNINIERSIADGTKGLFDTDVYKNFSTQINGSIQHTQGSTALIRDIGAMFSGGGLKALSAKDETINRVASVDIALGALTGGATIAGGIVGSFIGTPGVGTVVGATAAWAVTDLLWEGWKWVKENLLDQHGCYIQYLNKDGQPMDAGLSVAQGVAVGTNHTVSLFPSIVGLSGKVDIAKDGHYRITINDMLGSLGYSEVETLSIYRDTSMFVNQINAEILKISGRDTLPVGKENYIVVKANVLDVNGENIDSTGRRDSGVEDGDTLNVRIVESVEGFTAGQIVKVRLSFINTYELEYHDDDTTSFNETDQVPYNDMGKLAYDYLVARFSTAEARKIVLRINRRDPKDHFGRTIATVFHNTPLGTPQSERLNVLKSYAQSSPAIPMDSYLDDGRPYTLNWEMVMTGYGAIDMRESLWDTSWRKDALNFGEI